MKQFGTILKFELQYYAKNKVFVGVTVFLVALIAVAMFFPRLASLFASEGQEETVSEDRPVLLVCAEDPSLEALASPVFSAAFPGYEVQPADEAAVRERVGSGEAECGFVLDSLTSYTYYVNNLTMYDSNTAAADEALRTVYRLSAMEQHGIDAQEAQQILSAPVAHSVENLGADQTKSFFYTYIMIFALYMVILLYGQMVATNVATEKSSRAMEVLITSAKPVAMMFGKVISSCLAGLTQLLCVFGTALLCYRLTSSDWDGNPIVSSLFGIPPYLLGYMLLFFLLGFLLYAFLFGAVGSTATKLEDINTSVMPITLVFVLAFLVVLPAMTSGTVDSPLMIVCSFLPFTSPMAMFTRIAMSTVPVWEIVLSVAILAASVAGIGVLSAKIYRVGVLLYGSAPKIKDIFRMLRRA